MTGRRSAVRGSRAAVGAAGLGGARTGRWARIDPPPEPSGPSSGADPTATSVVVSVGPAGTILSVLGPRASTVWTTTWH